MASLAVLAVLLDQASKWYIRSTMPPSTSIPVIDGVFNITHVRNMGAAFGLMPGQQPLFIATSLVVVVGVIGYCIVKRPAARWLVIALGLVVGGATGNLIDRTSSTGLVTDFFDFALIDFPVFNIADCAIFVGVAMLVVWVLFAPESDAWSQAEPQDTVSVVDDEVDQ